MHHCDPLEPVNIRNMGSNRKLFLISNLRRILNVVFFLLGDSPASVFYVPTFRNTVSSIYIGCVEMELTVRSEMLAHKIQIPGNHRKERLQQLEIHFRYTTFRRVSLFRGMH